MRTRRSRFELGLVFSGAGLLAASVAGAQAQPQSTAPPLEQVIVTAQKRESSLQSVPFSVAATSDEAIRIRTPPPHGDGSRTTVV